MERRAKKRGGELGAWNRLAFRRLKRREIKGFEKKYLLVEISVLLRIDLANKKICHIHFQLKFAVA